MKIGIEAQRIYRTGKHGMEVVALELIGQIRQLDTTNQYLLFAADGPDRNCIKDSPNFHSKIIRGFSYADREQLSLPRAVRRENLSLLHCTANTAPLSCPVPILLTLHDIIFLEQINYSGSAYQNFGNLYRRAVVPKAIKNAVHIITVSESEKKIITDFCQVPPEKISVIYNGVGERFHNRYEPGEIEKFRKKYDLPERFILFHGNTAPKKNTVNVIKAYIRYSEESASPLPLAITDYPEGAVYKLLRQSGRETMIAQFVFTGYVPSAEMPLLYNCASLFLYPSLRESFGLPLTEGMACGVPVITSGRPAMSEVAGGAAVLVNPESPEDIAKAIARISGDDVQQKEMISKGLIRAQAFSWKQSAMQLLALYKQFG
jgi:glycosyltransferase involved in cell wall biosynthesis